MLKLLFSVKTILFPSDCICVNILPNFEVVIFIVDYMVVRTALPYIYSVLSVTKAFKSSDKFCNKRIRRDRRPDGPFPRILNVKYHMNMIRVTEVI